MDTFFLIAESRCLPHVGLHIYPHGIQTPSIHKKKNIHVSTPLVGYKLCSTRARSRARALQSLYPTRGVDT